MIVIVSIVSQSFCNIPGSRRAIRRGSRQLAGYDGGGQAQYGGGGQCDEGGGGGDGVDFGGCQDDPDTGFCCVEKIECVDSLGNGLANSK